MEAPPTNKRARTVKEAKQTSITDLGEDGLSCILMFVALSGAKNLALAMAVSQVFMKLGKNSDVLRAADFRGMEMFEIHLPQFQKSNGLVSLAAQAGNPSAQYLLSKIMTMSWSRFLRPSNQHSTNSSPQALAFMKQVSAQMLPDFGAIHHYGFMRHFLRQCTPVDYEEMHLHVTNCVKYSSQQVYNHVCLVLGGMFEISLRLKRLGEWEVAKKELGIGTGDGRSIISVKVRLALVKMYIEKTATADKLRQLTEICEAQARPEADEEKDMHVRFEDLRQDAMEILDSTFLVDRNAASQGSSRSVWFSEV